MNKLNSILFVALTATTFFACKKEEEPVIVVPPSDGSSLTLEGKTAASPYANVVYVDLSADKQTATDRKAWNIAVSADSRFKVFLNSAYQTTAVATDKTDITAVTLANPGTSVNLNHDIMDAKTVSLVDYWDGDLNKTAFAGEVSATEAENKVYLLSYEGNKETDKWFKVKISRSGNSYKVQYARLGEAAIKTLTVNKEAGYSLKFISLENNAIVSAEPEKDKWDLVWGYSTYNSGLGSPYWVQDLIMLNSLGGVQAAEVLNTTVSYDDFTATQIATLSFSGLRDVIGTKWRSTQPATGAKADRFYVLKDASGNIYKLKFVSMGVGGDGGERGRPVIEYKLVKKA